MQKALIEFYAELNELLGVLQNSVPFLHNFVISQAFSEASLVFIDTKDGKLTYKSVHFLFTK